VRRLIARAGWIAVCALSLAGCIDSKDSILTDAKPVLGQTLILQLYTLRDGHAVDPERTRFKWDGKRYVHADGSLEDVASFTLHAFEGGDTIVQSVSARHPEHVEYALMRTLTAGVFIVTPIDEDDADAGVRAAQCKHPEGVACRIETRDQLFTFARATAAKKNLGGGLAILLGDAKRR
jgi:hypothetical protein